MLEICCLANKQLEVTKINILKFILYEKLEFSVGVSVFGVGRSNIYRMAYDDFMLSYYMSLSFFMSLSYFMRF